MTTFWTIFIHVYTVVLASALLFDIHHTMKYINHPPVGTVYTVVFGVVTLSLWEIFNGA